MNLTITNKKNFIEKFLVPLNKLNENIILRVGSDKISSTVSTNDGVLILHCVYNIETDIEESCNLNIPNISKLIKVLQCIESDDIELIYEDNTIRYKSDKIKFKYHLLEDGILTAPSISIEKVKKLNFDTTTAISYNNILNILKGSTFTTDTNKIYFFTKDGAVHGELTDRQKHNVDSYTQLITSTYTGSEISDPLPLDFEVIRLISTIRFDEVNMHIAQANNVFMFNIEQECSKLTYIASGFTN